MAERSFCKAQVIGSIPIAGPTQSMAQFGRAGGLGPPGCRFESGYSDIMWYGRDSNGHFLTSEEPSYIRGYLIPYQVTGAAWFYVDPHDSFMLGFPELKPGEFKEITSLVAIFKDLNLDDL